MPPTTARRLPDCTLTDRMDQTSSIRMDTARQRLFYKTTKLYYQYYHVTVLLKARCASFRFLYWYLLTLNNVRLGRFIYIVNTLYYWQENKYVKFQYDLEISKWSYSIATNLTAIELSNLIQESDRRNFSISVLRPPWRPCLMTTWNIDLDWIHI